MAGTRRPRKARPTSRPRKRPSPPRFVGRDASPVLDHYPPKEPSAPVAAPRAATPPVAARSPPAPSAVPPPASAPAAPGGALPKSLITLERPFSVDEFGERLGEPMIRATVPREDLPEVLRRVSDFMGFGIYVYSIRVRPAPEETLTKFLVELERVDYSPSRREWVTFEETGRSDSPFGPGATR